jgi:hypothetical protein
MMTEMPALTLVMRVVRMKMGGGLVHNLSIGVFMMCSMIQENTVFTLARFLCNTFYIWQSSVFSFWYGSK